jgi:hypothetical protein
MSVLKHMVVWLFPLTLAARLRQGGVHLSQGNGPFCQENPRDKYPSLNRRRQDRSGSCCRGRRNDPFVGRAANPVESNPSWRPRERDGVPRPWRGVSSGETTDGDGVPGVPESHRRFRARSRHRASRRAVTRIR